MDEERTNGLEGCLGSQQKPWCQGAALATLEERGKGVLSNSKSEHLTLGALIWNAGDPILISCALAFLLLFNEKEAIFTSF
jgi:hypothetical protein